MTTNHDDDFHRGYHGIPDNEKLKAMSDIALFSMLSDCQPNTPKYMAVNAEKLRRESNLAKGENIVTKMSANPSEKPSPDHWYKKPIAVIIFAVIAGCIILFIRFIAINHFGISL